MSKPLCPHCHQPMPAQFRWGIYLTPMQTIVLDTIRDNPGISTESLVVKCGVKLTVLRVCIFDINSKLEETGVRISGQQRGKRGQYSIMRRWVKGAA